MAPSVVATRQGQRAFPVAQGQHQHLMPIGELGLIQDQDDRLALGDRLLQNLARERFHGLVAEDQRIAQKTGDPLVAHVRAVGLQRQAGCQVHQVRTSSIVATRSASLPRWGLR